ncbi:YceI family protein [Ferriphaselus sp. R-1]|uniref:YceI family protein n=1 Tax=Ferriphaselus sp. R-1 TaxID=1485544 RepID=UPI000551471D|nr:YceI family protein [Ferriphaselus sp. R-1]
MNKLLSALLLCLASSAGAAEFKQLLPAESSVTFAYKQMGVPMEGRFGKFNAQLSFDPAKLTTAQARLDIALASLDTGVAEADQEAAGKLWFNTAAFPTASFVSSGIKALGGNRYEASGKLTLKGRTLDIVTPVTFSTNGAKGAFDGAFSIRRLDYKIGEGEWADVSAVANEVQIKFHLVVTATPGKK